MSLLRRHVGLLLALCISLACIGLRAQAHREDWQSWGRFDLPAFDAYVYLAMIEQPAFFTTYPWGYRFVAPWIAHQLPIRDPLLAYRCLTLFCLVASGPLLFLFLRRLGHSPPLSLLGVAVFALSSPVEVLVESPYLADPLAVLLELVLLLALQAEIGLVWLAVVFVWGVYAKELFLAFPAVVFTAELPRGGLRRALLRAAVVGIAPFAAIQLLRAWWTPHLATPTPAITFDLLRRAALDLMGDSWSSTWPALTLSGLVPLAVAGAFFARARPFLRRFGILLAPTLALPVLGWAAVPGETAMFMFGDNTLRLMVYALPLLLPLALVAVDGVLPQMRLPAPPQPLRRPALAWALLVASLALPLLLLDRYRRVPFRHVRDGPLVLTLCRQSLRTARLVEAGHPVVWDLDALGFDPASRDQAQMQRMRWFLWQGFGSQPQYASGPAVIQEPSADLLLPVLEPGDRELLLTMSGQGTLMVSAGERLLASATLRTEPTGVAVHVPADVLVRGDNRISLRPALPDAVLHRVRIGTPGSALEPEVLPRSGPRRRRGGS